MITGNLKNMALIGQLDSKQALGRVNIWLLLWNLSIWALQGPSYNRLSLAQSKHHLCTLK